MKYLGDFIEDATVYIYFTTNNSSGAAVAPSTAFEAADVNIYKDNSAVQKTSDNGITMTSPFDSITGLHLVAIDTSNDTGDAGFWVTGADYSVILSPDETVDSQAIAHPLAQFSIENRITSNVYSDTTAIHSETTVIQSDTTAIHSDTTIIASDVVLVYSDTTAIHSDTTIIHSDTVVISSDTAVIESDTTAIHSDTTIIASDVVILVSDTTAIHSDTTIIASDVVLVYSDTTAIHSDTTIIASDVVLVYSDTAAIHSDTTIIASDVVLIYSDTTALEAGVTLANGAHGGVAAVLTLERIIVASTTASEPAIKATGAAGEAGMELIGGTNMAGLLARADSASVTYVGGAPGAAFRGDGGSAFGSFDTDQNGGIKDTVLTTIASDVVILVSDTTAIHSDTTIIASDVVLVYSDTAAIHSDTTIIASDVVIIGSDVVQVYSDTTVIASDLVIVTSDVALIETTRAEPGQGAPAATTDFMTKIDHLYKAWRNKTEQTSTTMSIYDDAGTTVDTKSTISDDGTTFTSGEKVTGP